MPGGFFFAKLVGGRNPKSYLYNRRYKLHGIVTNRTTPPGDEVIFWYWARCGKSEEVHAVMKEDLAGGKLPSDSFGVNAAWWAIILRRASLMAPLKNFNVHQYMILACNLNMAMKTLVLGKNWVNARMKAIRFSLINLPGRIVVHHARELIVRLTGGHDSTPLPIEIRRKNIGTVERRMKGGKCFYFKVRMKRICFEAPKASVHLDP